MKLLYTPSRTQLVKNEPKQRVEKTFATGLALPGEQRKSWIVFLLEAEGNQYPVAPSQQEISEFKENTARNITIYTPEVRLLPWLLFWLTESRVLQSSFAFSRFRLIFCVIGNQYPVTPSQQEISEFQENTVRNITIYTSEARLLPWLAFSAN